jgi:hypothetical protein
VGHLIGRIYYIQLLRLAFLHFHNYPPAEPSHMWLLSLLFGLGFVFLIAERSHPLSTVTTMVPLALCYTSTF